MGEEKKPQEEGGVLEMVREAEEVTVTFWSKHRLSLLLFMTIFIALIMTSVSVTIYSVSGAAQLDLSRPGYRSVSSQVEKDDITNEFTTTGPINEESIKEFQELYGEQVDKATSIDAFNGDPLNPELLQLAPHTDGQ